ncbi:Splicing factor 1 [Perkinsus chesapeaki]|uniref:Splicing factor 1 n=1 Tax=Perkinsus chesapeaki TaxID=330153 RepID=A0A7J6N2D8_PERCH|nr:Splicing factor 1 [Perkinsus chesapeaki]
MASSSVTQGGQSSSACIVGAPIKKLVSPSPPDDDDDDDEFSRLLNAHKKARDDGDEYPRTTPSGNIQPVVKRQRINYGDIDGSGARRYTSENPRRKGGIVGTRPIEHTSRGLVPPRPLRFPFPPYCGPLAKLVSSGPPPPLPVDERSIMLQQLLERVQYLTNENERLTYIVADQQTLLSGGGGAPVPHPLPHPPPSPAAVKQMAAAARDASPSNVENSNSSVVPPWRSKKATLDTPIQSSSLTTDEKADDRDSSNSTEEERVDEVMVAAAEDTPVNDIGHNTDTTVVPISETRDERRRGLDLWEPSGWSGGQLVVVDGDRSGQMALYGTVGPSSSGRGRGGHKRRRLHLGPKEEISYRPRPLVDLPVGLTITEIDQLMREIRLEDLRRKIANKELELADDDVLIIRVRAPSPPPVYNSLGQKINSREMRVKHQMHDELNRLCHYMIKTVPNYTPPPEYRPPKYIKKVIVPVRRYPTENFMGVLIGPRGCNHRLLKEILDCDITLRGRGTGKHMPDFGGVSQLNSGDRSSSSAVASWLAEEDANLPLHVHISGDDEDRVNEAVEFIKKCLTPGSREYEALQSRGRDTLAVINGTVGIGSNYHQRQLRVLEADGIDEIERWRALARHVRCEICGDKGHPTIDCPRNRMPSHDELMEDWRLNKEYNDLMSSVIHGDETTRRMPSNDNQHTPPPSPLSSSEPSKEVEEKKEKSTQSNTTVPAPLPPIQTAADSSPSDGNDALNEPEPVATATATAPPTPTHTHVPRPLAAGPGQRKQRRPLAPHPLRTMPIDHTLPYQGVGGANPYYPSPSPPGPYGYSNIPPTPPLMRPLPPTYNQPMGYHQPPPAGPGYGGQYGGGGGGHYYDGYY